MIKKVCKIVLIAQILSLPIYADDTDPFFAQHGYVLLKDSWVFSPEKAKEVRNKLIDLQTAQKQNESYKTSLQLQQDMLDLQDKKTKLYSDQNDKLAQSLQSERSMSNFERLVIFGLGIAATVFAGFAIKKAGQ